MSDEAEHRHDVVPRQQHEAEVEALRAENERLQLGLKAQRGMVEAGHKAFHDLPGLLRHGPDETNPASQVRIAYAAGWAEAIEAAAQKVAFPTGLADEIRALKPPQT